MTIAISVTPSAGTAAQTFHHVEVSGLDDTDFSTYDSTPDVAPYKAEADLTYYFQFSEGGLIKGRSHVFTPDSSTGKGVWDSVSFPDAGTYTVSVHRASTGATLKSTAVVVS